VKEMFSGSTVVVASVAFFSPQPNTIEASRTAGSKRFFIKIEIYAIAK